MKAVKIGNRHGWTGEKYCLTSKECETIANVKDGDIFRRIIVNIGGIVSGEYK